MFLNSFRLIIFEEIMSVFKDLPVLPKYILNNETVLIFYFLFDYFCYQDWLEMVSML